MKFRDWLVDRLSDTTHAAMNPRSSTAQIERRAETLGVRPDVLRDAMALLAKRRAAAGVSTMAGVKLHERDHPQMRVRMPREVFDRWIDYSEQSGLKGSAVLRSVIHAYLLGDWEPGYAGKRWVLDGRVFTTGDSNRWPYYEKCLVTAGARHALYRRARRLGARVADVLRGLVLEVLAGNLRDVRVIDASAMYGDPTLYLGPDSDA